MKNSSKATALLIALTVELLFLPRLASAVEPVPYITPIHRLAQLLLLALAFVVGWAIVKRKKQRRTVALVYASAVNLLALSLMSIVLIPGNEDMADLLVYWGFFWICRPCLLSRPGQDLSLSDLLDLFFDPVFCFWIAFLLTLCELGFLHLVGQLRRRWARRGAG